MHTQRNNEMKHMNFKNACWIRIPSPLPWHVRSTERAAACPAGTSQTASCIQYLSSGSPDDLIQSPPSGTGKHTLCNTVQNYPPINTDGRNKKKKKTKIQTYC